MTRSPKTFAASIAAIVLFAGGLMLGISLVVDDGTPQHQSVLGRVVHEVSSRRTQGRRLADDEQRYTSALSTRRDQWLGRLDQACGDSPWPRDEVAQLATEATQRVVAGAMEVHLGKRTLEEQRRAESEIYAQLAKDLTPLAKDPKLPPRCAALLSGS